MFLFDFRGLIWVIPDSSETGLLLTQANITSSHLILMLVENDEKVESDSWQSCFELDAP